MGTTANTGAPLVGSRQPGRESGTEVMAAATLTGNYVMNSDGESLGYIEAIMLDLPSGRVAYAVLSFGGLQGAGDRLFAVPWPALKLDTGKKCFILDVDKDRLQDAPSFHKDHWPSMADTSWAGRVHSYYGTKPYWE